MHKLTFKSQDVAKLVIHARKAKKHRPYYEDMGFTQIGAHLCLVGDAGVYLMSSGLPYLKKKGGEPNHSYVVYADGLDPSLDFDLWWPRKQALQTRGDFALRIPIAAFDKLDLKAKGTITIAWPTGQDCMIFGPDRFTVELPGQRPKAFRAIA